MRKDNEITQETSALNLINDLLLHCTVADWQERLHKMFIASLADDLDKDDRDDIVYTYTVLRKFLNNTAPFDEVSIAC